MIKTLSKTSNNLAKLKSHVAEQHRQEASNEIDDLIYLLKIKNLLYEHIRPLTIKEQSKTAKIHTVNF